MWCPDSGHEPHLRAAAGPRAAHQISRRVQQEPLHRPHLHHAGAGAAPAVPCAASWRPSIWSSAARNVLLGTIRSCAAPRSAQIIELAREAGARKGISPRQRRQCDILRHCIDMPARSELVAAGRDVEEVAREIGADWLIYQDLETWSRRAGTTCQHHRVRYVVLLGRLCDGGTSLRNIWHASRKSVRWREGAETRQPLKVVS